MDHLLKKGGLAHLQQLQRLKIEMAPKIKKQNPGCQCCFHWPTTIEIGGLLMQILIFLTTFHPEYILTRLSGNDHKWIKNGSKKNAVSITLTHFKNG